MTQFTKRNTGAALSCRARALGVITAAACLAGAPATGKASDFTVTLARDFLERVVENAITQEVTAGDSGIYWGEISGRPVEISRRSESKIDIDLDLSYDLNNFTDPEVDVNIQVGLSCYFGQPHIELAAQDLEIGVNFPWYIDVATLGLSWVAAQVANVVIDKKIPSMERINQEVTAEINQQLGAVSFEFCPGIEVTNDADVQFIFGLGDECTSGKTRHRACLSGSHGSGRDETCVNGYWEMTAYDCEPNTPEGGHPL